MRRFLLSLISALMLCTGFNAMAYVNSGSHIYFDGTGWTNNCVQLMIGHDSYSRGEQFTKISNTNIYYLKTANSWGESNTRFAVFGTTGLWNDENTSMENRRNAVKQWGGDGARYTGIQYNYGINYNNSYLITSTGEENITTSYLGGGYNDLNHTHSINVDGQGTVAISSYKLNGTNSSTESKGETSCDAAYTATVICTAEAAEGYTFAGWYENDNVISTETTYSYVAANSARTIVAKFERMQVVISQLYFAGNIFDAEKSDHWSNPYEMTAEGEGIFTWTGKLYQEGEFKFRNTTGDTWDISFTTGDQNTYKLNEALPLSQDKDAVNGKWMASTGTYSVTVDVNAMTVTFVEVEEPITSFYFAGNIFDAERTGYWSNPYEMTAEGEGIFTWTGMLYQGGEFKFRNTTGDTWDLSYTTGNSNTYELNTPHTLYRDGDNGVFTASTGEYVVTVDVNAMTVTFEEAAVEVGSVYLITEAAWDNVIAMTTTDNNIYVWEGELYGAFKFRTNAYTSFGQMGSTDGATINIGEAYTMARTSTDAMQTFNMANAADNKMHVKVIVNLSENTMRVLPADVYIAGSAVVEVKSDGAWSTSTVQGCVHDTDTDVYTWTGYLYNNNGDADARFKFILASGYSNGGHLVPVAATAPNYSYEGVTYNLQFLWDVDTNGASGNQLFHAAGSDNWATDMAAGVMDNGTTTRIKVRAEINLGDMTVTFYKIDELHIENLFISGDATEHTAAGYGAMTAASDADGSYYYSITNFVDNASGFYFPLQDTQAFPALVAWEDDYVTTHFVKHGYDYSGYDGAVQNHFNVPSAGVYKVIVRPDYDEVRVYPYDALLPADGAYITLAERSTTRALKATFFEDVVAFDPSKVKIESEYMWWTGNVAIPCQVVARENIEGDGGIDGKTVSFGANSLDNCLADGETYTITFEQGAVTFASTTRAGETRTNPAFSYTVSIEDDPEIGTGVEGVTTDTFSYANGVVTAEGAIEVYNVGGAIVARGNDNVDLRALNAGVYIVRNGNQVRKVVR